MTTIDALLEPAVEDQQRFAEFIVDEVVNDAVGLTDGGTCAGEPPSARYYLGALAPRELDLSAGRTRGGRETANSLGFDVEVSADRGTLKVGAACSVYYRVFPTWEEQQRGYSGDVGTEPGGDFPLAVVFRRLELDDVEIDVPLSSDPATRQGEHLFRALFEHAYDLIADDPTTYRRVQPGRAHAPRVPSESMIDKKSFEDWCASVPGDIVVPTWSAYLSAVTRMATSGRSRVSLRFVNDSLDPQFTPPPRRVGAETEARAVHDDDRDHFLFRVRMEARGSGVELVPIAIDLGADAYRYDNRLSAYASNCGVRAEYRSENILSLVATEYAPVYSTSRIASRPDPSTSFEALERDPVPTLENLHLRMIDYSRQGAWSTDDLLPEQAAAKRRDLERYRAECDRFAAGVEWLRRDPRLELAFRLLNRTMISLGRNREMRSWRLFQLVFIVSQLPALAWREHPQEQFREIDGVSDPTSVASVLWYPTGGGKTEAYLGLSACAMFYDRTRGKGAGVTAWCRLPLRLLTLQATQRQVTFFTVADEVRLAAAVEIEALGGTLGDPFRVGLFMGQSNTPNSISRDPATVAMLRQNDDAREAFRVVDVCPYCNERAVRIDPPDEITLRLVHRCSACRREILVLITDHEVYRFLPSFVVGTVDKLATMGLTDKFGALLGDVDGSCDYHGYGRGGRCVERRAPDHPDARRSWHPLRRALYDPSPSLEIIDELHMLREEFGVFDGHYESGLANIQRELTARQRRDGRPVRMKVVATTATIKGEDRQCDHLFGMGSTALPLPGPTRDGSFYWTVQHDVPHRLFVGIQPQRITAEQTIVRVLTAFHRAIRKLDLEGRSADLRFAEMDDVVFARLLHAYRVSLTYVTSLIDFGKISRSLETQVNHALRGSGSEPVRVARVSADATRHGIGQIREIIDDLEAQSNNKYECVLATSSIAHGVDISRLNVMVFNGMPKSMAEYIQASSRVGRTFLGVVFTVFNPVRERDRSHFRYHGKFHEYLDRMVEPVAINRWSRYAARRTFPGVLMAEILQNGNRVWWNAGNGPRHLHELGQAQQAMQPLERGGIPEMSLGPMTKAMERAFLAHRPEAEEIRREIEEWATTAHGAIRAAGAAAGIRSGRNQYRATAEHLGLYYEPMTSLRDVEEDVPIVVLDRRTR